MAKSRLIVAAFIILIPYQILLGQCIYPRHALGVQTFDNNTIQNLAVQKLSGSYLQHSRLSHTATMAAAASTMQSNVYPPSLSNNNRLTGIRVGGHPFSISINPNTNMIYVASILPKRILFIDGNTDRVLNSISIPGEPYNNSAFKQGVHLSSVIAVNPATNLLYVAYADSDILYVMDGSKGDMVARDPISGSPRSLGADVDPTVTDVYATTIGIIKHGIGDSTIYRINTFFNVPTSYNISNDTLNAVVVNSTLEGKNQHKVVYAIGDKQKKIYVLIPLSSGKLKLVDTILLNKGISSGYGIAVNPRNNMIYVTDYSNHNGKYYVYAIDGKMHKLVKTISVGNTPNGVAINPNTNMIYVTNSASNSISVINGTTERVVRTIPVDYNPRSIVINPRTDIIYVANALSGTVSVIDGKTNNVMSGVNFNVNPPNSGIISCNDKRILNNYTRYDLNTSLNCDAIPNPGFDFSSWSGDLSSNSNTTGAPTTLSDYLFGWLSARMNSSSSPNNNPMIQFPVSHYGKVNANFIQHASVSMPPEFWAAISATITSFFIPSIVGWLKGRMQRGNLRKCLDMIDSKHDKLDLNTIKNEIQELYAKGKISDSHYEVLKDKISEYYT